MFYCKQAKQNEVDRRFQTGVIMIFTDIDLHDFRGLPGKEALVSSIE